LNLPILFFYILITSICYHNILDKINYNFWENTVLKYCFIYGIIIGICLLFSYTKITFKSNQMIIKKLLRKTVFNLDKYPRIFTTRIYHRRTRETHSRPYISHYLYFQQNDKKIKIHLYSFYIKKIKRFLENLEIVSLDEVSEEKRLLSATEREIIVENHIKNNQEKRIVGIKDINQKIALKKAPGRIIVVLCITFFIIFGIACYFNTEMEKLGTGIGGAIIIEMLILLIVVIAIIYEYSRIFTNISYSEDRFIKVNKGVFNYQENIVKIKVYKRHQREPIMNGEEEINLNDYIFKISDNLGNFERTNLGQCDSIELKRFLENIEFED